MSRGYTGFSPPTPLVLATNFDPYNVATMAGRKPLLIFDKKKRKFEFVARTKFCTLKKNRKIYKIKKKG